MKRTKYLIVRADGSARVNTAKPRLRFDEIAFRLEITIPDLWGRVMPDLVAVDLPEPNEEPGLRVIGTA